MLEHLKHGYYTDLVYCPLKKAYETFIERRQDDEPGCEECQGCGELIEVKELAVSAA